YINELKEKGDKNGIKFPENLEYVGAYFDEEFSSSGCAFLDKNTGEVTIGFAGTNNKNDYFWGDAKADGAIGIGGISKDSNYMKKPNEFIEELRDKGYNITTVTGHSLGGGIGGYMAVYQDIPFGVLYNAAPLFVFSKDGHTDHLNDMHTDEIKKVLDEYTGKLIRITSSNDGLNIISDKFGGTYVGEEFIIQNGNGHDMELFLKQLEQKFNFDTTAKAKFEGMELDFFDDSELKITFDEKNNPVVNFDNKGKIELDVDGDGQANLTLNYSELMPSNFWTGENKNNFNEKAIIIDTNAFLNLSANLKNNIAQGDIEWIIDAIQVCESENSSIKGQINGRFDELCDSIVDALNNANLSKLLYEIDSTHGELMTPQNKNVLHDLRYFNTSNISYKLNKYDSEWFLDGVSFDSNTLSGWIKDVQNASKELYEEITGTVDEFNYEKGGANWFTKYRVDSISTIANAFGDVTNGFLIRTEEVFKGIGLRTGKDDGIVDAISEVLEVEEKNIIELKAKIENVAEIAQVIADNFEETDEQLAKCIENGINIKSDVINGPSTYNAYLEENHILDDVKDILEAYDLQVEKAASQLASYIVLDFAELIRSTNSKLNKIVEALRSFKTSVTEIEKRLDKSITSREWKGTGQYDMYKEQVTENHGSFSNFLSGDIGYNIRQAKSRIIPILDDLPTTLYTLQGYSVLIENLKSEFTAIIEKAVYEYNDLDGIVKAQNMISGKVYTMINEITNVNNVISEDFKGGAVNSYKEQLQEVLRLLNYFNSMIIDCFGENSNY
ncbi:MAG: SA1320 family protein, partial [Sarcina sp.]